MTVVGVDAAADGTADASDVVVVAIAVVVGCL